MPHWATVLGACGTLVAGTHRRLINIVWVSWGGSANCRPRDATPAPPSLAVASRSRSSTLSCVQMTCRSTEPGGPFGAVLGT